MYAQHDARMHVYVCIRARVVGRCVRVCLLVCVCARVMRTGGLHMGLLARGLHRHESAPGPLPAHYSIFLTIMYELTHMLRNIVYELTNMSRKSAQ